MEIGKHHARGLLLGADATMQSVLGLFGIGYKEFKAEADPLIVLAKDNLCDRKG
jgi:hypothetical protein